MRVRAEKGKAETSKIEVSNSGVENNEIAVGEANFIPWIMAVADQPEKSSAKKQRQLANKSRPSKKIGEISEAAFLLRAVSLGLGVAKPWGDSERFDCIVWAQGGPLLRVQVKCTSRLHHRGYAIQPTCGSGDVQYTVEDIDFLAAHVQSLDIWYLLPAAAFAPANFLKFYPDIKARGPLWEAYREAWDLLRDWKKPKRKRCR